MPEAQDDKQIFGDAIDKLHALRREMNKNEAEVLNLPEDVAASHRQWLGEAYESGHALGLSNVEIIKLILRDPVNA